MNYDIKNLMLPLPGDVEKLKHAGELALSLRRIDEYLRAGSRPQLRDRLLIERQRLLRIPHEYPYSYDEAFEKARAAIQGLTREEFDQCAAAGDADWVLREGGKHFFIRFLPAMLDLRPDLRARAPENPREADARLPLFREKLKKEGEVRARIHMRYALSLEKDAFTPGFARVHIPVPLPTAQQSDIEIRLPGEPGWTLSRRDAPAGTACFEGELNENRSLAVEYEYTAVMRYFDASQPPRVLYPDAAPVTEDDTAEKAPHILFTPYLRALCRDICADKKEPLDKARAIYDHITTQVRYSYMPEYILLPNIPEFAARNLKGDCGVQALLFITLCRIAGIPARWQSGLMLHETSGGSHDWAQFYVPKWGWLFADCSFGGSAYRRGDRLMQDFYFGNLDVYRLAAASDFQAPFEPEKQFPRIDPYDDQSGEWETDSRMLQSEEIDTDAAVLKCSM